LSVSFVEDDILYWPLMINTGKYQEMLPGIISLHLRIQDAAQRGIRTFNMSYGDFDYKRQAATHTEARNVAVIINPYSLRGRLVGAWYAYKSKKGVRFN
jgi:CelD/BcsL family acetyltransferase involved in cellulose biosynthesis